MNTCAIRRRRTWRSRGGPQDIRWIRSYVIAEADGTLASIWIYQAAAPKTSSPCRPPTAHRVGMPAGDILDVADLVVIRPDPDREPAAS
jgi:hypothetical protein